MSTELVCSRCGGALELGFIPEHSYNAQSLSAWFQGMPTYNWLLGWVFPKKNKRISIVAYRCSQCGHLELFAGPERPKYLEK